MSRRLGCERRPVVGGRRAPFGKLLSASSLSWRALFGKLLFGSHGDECRGGEKWPNAADWLRVGGRRVASCEWSMEIERAKCAVEDGEWREENGEKRVGSGGCKLEEWAKWAEKWGRKAPQERRRQRTSWAMNDDKLD